jgi:hypothetical protein
LNTGQAIATPVAGTRLPRVTAARVFGAVVTLLLVWGFTARLDRYITPERGLGYALGIVGGSLMLLLLIYPARKRADWLGFVGGVTGWFRLHMVLGIVGPLLVLFHANFALGALNSNVALFLMLAVSGSGIVGRYIYSRIYGNWAEEQQTLAGLQGVAEQMRRQSNSTAVLPELMSVVEAEERRLFAPARTLLGTLARAGTAGLRTLLARWRIERKIRRMVLEAARQSPTLAAQGQRLIATSYGYAVRRLEANRRVAEHHFYMKLFSYWHVAHVPFFIMLLVAGVVHVISVHVY